MNTTSSFERNDLLLDGPGNLDEFLEDMDGFMAFSHPDEPSPASSVSLSGGNLTDPERSPFSPSNAGQYPTQRTIKSSPLYGAASKTSPGTLSDASLQPKTTGSAKSARTARPKPAVRKRMASESSAVHMPQPIQKVNIAAEIFAKTSLVTTFDVQKAVVRLPSFEPSTSVPTSIAPVNPMSSSPRKNIRTPLRRRASSNPMHFQPEGEFEDDDSVPVDGTPSESFAPMSPGSSSPQDTSIRAVRRVSSPTEARPARATSVKKQQSPLKAHSASQSLRASRRPSVDDGTQVIEERMRMIFSVKGEVDGSQYSGTPPQYGSLPAESMLPTLQGGASLMYPNASVNFPHEPSSLPRSKMVSPYQVCPFATTALLPSTLLLVLLLSWYCQSRARGPLCDPLSSLV